jgi:hypothetical protein
MSKSSFFRECALCGKNAKLVYRWFKYDNGEQFSSPVCPKCADLHDRLVRSK